MPDCKTCKKHCQNVDLTNVDPVSYIAHEAEMARIEREHDKEREQHKRTVRWLCSIIVILTLGLIGMFIYETQFTNEIVTVESNTDDGGTAIANASGGVTYYGESEGNS